MNTVGVQGILSAYQMCLSQVKLHGPTNFAPIIYHVAQFAAAAKSEPTPKVLSCWFCSHVAVWLCELSFIKNGGGVYTEKPLQPGFRHQGTYPKNPPCFGVNLSKKNSKNLHQI